MVTRSVARRSTRSAWGTWWRKRYSHYVQMANILSSISSSKGWVLMATWRLSSRNVLRSRWRTNGSLTLPTPQNRHQGESHWLYRSSTRLCTISWPFATTTQTSVHVPSLISLRTTISPYLLLILLPRSNKCGTLTKLLLHCFRELNTLINGVLHMNDKIISPSHAFWSVLLAFACLHVCRITG